jgi:hypothetical protein
MCHKLVARRVLYKLKFFIIAYNSGPLAQQRNQRTDRWIYNRLHFAGCSRQLTYQTFIIKNLTNLESKN